MAKSIYQGAEGGWIYFDGETKHHFATQQEAISMNKKEQYVTSLQGAATTLAQVADQFADKFTIYFDRGYNPNGADAIQDEDIAVTGMTAAQVADLMNLAEQLDKFLNNAAVTSGDYDAILNVARTDV